MTGINMRDNLTTMLRISKSFISWNEPRDILKVVPWHFQYGCSPLPLKGSHTVQPTIHTRFFFKRQKSRQNMIPHAWKKRLVNVAATHKWISTPVTQVNIYIVWKFNKINHHHVKTHGIRQRCFWEYCSS